MHLRGPNSSLHRLVMIVEEVVNSQERAINHSFEESLSVKMVHHNISMFEDLLFKVSHAATELLLTELKKIESLKEAGKTCDHQLFTSCRLDSYIDKGNTITLLIIIIICVVVY